MFSQTTVKVMVSSHFATPNVTGQSYVDMKIVKDSI
jgi:hypothetical protein